MRVRRLRRVNRAIKTDRAVMDRDVMSRCIAGGIQKTLSTRQCPSPSRDACPLEGGGRRLSAAYGRMAME